MKIFTAILSFYILVLGLIPCSDVPKDNATQNIEISQNTTDSHHSEADHCSAFCTCNCCVSPLIYQAFSIQLKLFSLVEKYYSNHNSDFVSSLYASIWQPPKLS